jgi:hypothetical protein
MPFVKSIFKLISKCQIIDLPSKNTYLLTIGLHTLYIISDTIHSLLFHHVGLRDPFKSNCFKTLFSELHFANLDNSLIFSGNQPSSECNKIIMRLRTNLESYAHKHSHGIYRSSKIPGIHFT